MPNASKASRHFPVTPLSRDGGIFPRWRDAKTLEWGSGQKFFTHHIDTKKTDTVTLTTSVTRGAVARGRSPSPARAS